jgi:electron transfer flavoprotein beta subunit
MKVLVCISNVPDTTSKIQFTADGSAFDPQGVQFVINPYDEFSLTRALWIKEQQGGTVTVVHVGPASAEPTIRKALAIGADDAVRIDLDPMDGFSVAQELSALVREQGFDLVLAGRESIDYNGGQVPGMLAALLGWPFVNGCVGMEISGDKAELTREIDGGREKLSASFPMVVAGQKGLVEEKDLRIPNMRGIMTARTKPLVVRPAQSSNAERTRAMSFEKPIGKQACVMLGPDEMGELVRRLHENAKVI